MFSPDGIRGLFPHQTILDVNVQRSNTDNTVGLAWITHLWVDEALEVVTCLEGAVRLSGSEPKSREYPVRVVGTIRCRLEVALPIALLPSINVAVDDLRTRLPSSIQICEPTKERNNTLLKIKVTGTDVQEFQRWQQIIMDSLEGDSWVGADGKSWSTWFESSQGHKFLEMHADAIRVDRNRRVLYLVGKKDALQKELKRKVGRHTYGRRVLRIPHSLADYFDADLFHEWRTRYPSLEIDTETQTISIIGSDADFFLLRSALDTLYFRHKLEQRGEVLSPCANCDTKIIEPVQLFCGHICCLTCTTRLVLSCSEKMTFPIRSPVGLGEGKTCNVPIQNYMLLSYFTLDQQESVRSSAIQQFLEDETYAICTTAGCIQVQRRFNEKGERGRCMGCGHLFSQRVAEGGTSGSEEGSTSGEGVPENWEDSD